MLARSSTLKVRGGESYPGWLLPELCDKCLEQLAGEIGSRLEAARRGEVLLAAKPPGL